MGFRVYKYLPGHHEFLPHFDDGWEGSAMSGEEDCLAHWESCLVGDDENELDAPDLDDHEKSDPQQQQDPTNEPHWSSMMSCLLYLNSVEQGGATQFWEIDPTFKPDPNQSYEQNMRAATTLRHSQAPERGSALCFFHGAHELSALHSGDKVLSGDPK